MRLAIAFGSRGKGNALAHYEPGRVVINLTKMKGAGSLAHEFGHALDDMLGQRVGLYGVDTMLSDNVTRRQFMRDQEVADAMKKVVQTMCKSSFTVEDVMERCSNIKKNTESLLEHCADRIIEELCKRDTSSETEARLEVLKQRIMHGDETAISDIMMEQEKVLGARVVIQESSLREYMQRIKDQIDNMNNAEEYLRKFEGRTKMSDYYTWARKLDQGRKKQYYSSMPEMFARAFEAFVEDKLYENNIISQYLVHSTRANSAYGSIKPYPEGVEREAINNAIQELIQLVYSKYKDEFGPMTNYGLYSDEDDFVSYQDSIVVVHEPRRRRTSNTSSKESKGKNSEMGGEPYKLTGELKDFRDALLTVAGNNTKRTNKLTDEECMAYMNKLADVGKKDFGYKAVGFQDLRTIHVNPMGNSKSYFTDGPTIRIDSNKPREKQLEALVECLVYRMVLGKYGFSNAANMLAEGTSYIMLKAIGLDVRTYCLSERFEDLAKDIEQSKVFLKLCKENYMAFKELIK